MADTRNLTGSARLLYNGIEETRHGKKIKICDRARALENIAKHLGMFDSKVEAEETGPLSRLVNSLMDAASTVPVGTQPSTTKINTHDATGGPSDPKEP